MLALSLLLAPAFAQQLIVDNRSGSPDFTTTGDDWTHWETLGYGYDSGDTDYLYLTHTQGGSDRRGTATWSPDIPTAGIYRMETWFRRTENRSHDADFFVVDGAGSRSRTTLDQRGEGASGWVSLGEHSCASGRGGCSVVLDGTDDDLSDEANAVRFTLVSATEEPEDPQETEDCGEFPGLGDHRMTLFASDSEHDGWDAARQSRGQADGTEASSPNLDSGEYLRGSGWGACDPPGEETITGVQVAVKARTQYGSSGAYAIIVDLQAGGASTQWSQTSLGWVTLELGPLSWAEVDALVAQVSLNSHPTGQRDSDVWVDAFRVRVDYTSTSAPDTGEPEDEPEPEDTGMGPQDTDFDDDAPGDWPSNDDDPPSSDWGDSGGAALDRDGPFGDVGWRCSSGGAGGAGAGGLAVLGLLIGVRRRPSW